MKVVILWMVLALLFFPCGFVRAESYGIGQFADLSRDRDEMVIGTIQSVDRNTLNIYDETEKVVKRLVYLDYSQPFHKGDRVRAYYRTDGNVVTVIKKVTLLEYSKNGQNLGYPFKRDGK